MNPTPTTSKRRILTLALGVLIGGAFGFAYWRFIGCAAGTCPLTSNPWLSTLYGTLLGGLIAKLFR
jgi:hypothetical protein